MDLRKIVATVAGLLLVIGVVLAFMNRETSEPQPMDQNPNNSNSQNDTTQLSPTAETFTSDRLGVTFTYEPKPIETFEVVVTERDNKIYVHGTEEEPEQGKTIEVFSKDASLSLSDAIKLQFLKNIAVTDCFVEDIARSPEDPRPGSYIFAEISYPPPATPDAPFWENSFKCPQEYSKTNAVQYFMMNQEVPTKFIFVKLGQDSITTDGVVRDGESRYDWSSSIRIVK